MNKMYCFAQNSETVIILFLYSLYFSKLFFLITYSVNSIWNFN